MSAYVFSIIADLVDFEILLIACSSIRAWELWNQSAIILIVLKVHYYFYYYTLKLLILKYTNKYYQPGNYSIINYKYTTVLVLV